MDKKEKLCKMSIAEFIDILEKPGNKIIKHFVEADVFLKGMKQIRDEVVEQNEFKEQLLKIVKGFIAAKEMKVYDSKESKHTVLFGGPGIGKTMIAKILGDIFAGMGFIGLKQTSNVFANFKSLQDALLRRQKLIIHAYENKNKRVMQKINSTNKAVVIAKKCMALLIANPHPAGAQLTTELTRIIEIVESTNMELEELAVEMSPNMGGMEITADSRMTKTKNDPSHHFKTINPNDVISSYVGDTAQRCTKMMEECMDGIAYFDEAYNLCNPTRGYDDPYAKSALTIINLYMSEYPDRLIVIFSGYEGAIRKNLFKTQEGLESRFAYKFTLKEYSGDGLTKIYIIALKKLKLHIENTPHLRHIITENKKLFKFQGRDMYSLATYTKNIHAAKSFEALVEGKKVSNTISDIETIKQAVEDFKVMQGKDEEERDEVNLDALERRLREQFNL
jgi:hypothetical protein